MVCKVVLPSCHTAGTMAPEGQTDTVAPANKIPAPGVGGFMIAIIALVIMVMGAIIQEGGRQEKTREASWPLYDLYV